jgi:hypothetical protein
MQNIIASVLVAAGSFVPLVLGSAHLYATFRGNKLHPREPALIARMKETSPVISRDMTMWDAWVSFNATHSYGAMLFGLIYGYLALAQSDVLFSSWFLMTLGLVALGAYVFVGWRYWFSVPYRGVLLASALYVAGLLVRWAELASPARSRRSCRTLAV